MTFNSLPGCVDEILYVSISFTAAGIYKKHNVKEAVSGSRDDSVQQFLLQLAAAGEFSIHLREGHIEGHLIP